MKSVYQIFLLLICMGKGLNITKAIFKMHRMEELVPQHDKTYYTIILITSLSKSWRGIEISQLNRTEIQERNIQISMETSYMTEMHLQIRMEGKETLILMEKLIISFENVLGL